MRLTGEIKKIAATAKAPRDRRRIGVLIAA
jgi:hypothetical protein